MIKTIAFSQLGREVIEIEQKAIAQLIPRMDDNFDAICDTLLKCTGRVIVIGMGKSGHIGRKIAATLASTGTPSFFVHPAEAGHGDLGMLTRQDVVLALSQSGQTEEVINLLPLIQLQKIPLVVMTGNTQSQLALRADHVLSTRIDEEACPHGLAPTASTTAALVLGDAIAISLLKARGFGPNDFARFHPSGALGKKLLMRVDDIMCRAPQIPSVPAHASIAEALIEMNEKCLGITTIVSPERTLLGLFTDGDLRRAIEHGYDVRSTEITVVMTTQYAAVPPSMLATEALSIMHAKKITAIPVINPEQQTIGVIHLHDLIKAGIA